MQPTEFIPTVPHLSDQEATDAARAYPIVTGHILEASSVNGVLTDLDLIDIVYDVAQDKTHPARVKMLGVYIGLMGDHPFNFIQSTITGQRAISQLNWLITTGLPEHAERLTQFRDIMIWRANIVSYPMANLTLHETMVIRGTCPTKSLEAFNGYLTIKTHSNTPSHATRIHGVNPRTNANEILGHIRIDIARTYEFKIPSHYSKHTNFCVDDPYGVI